MKKLAVAISSTLLLASTAASAQFYLGAKAGGSWVDDLCSTGPCDDSSWALGSFLGYEFTEQLSLEAGLDSLGETTGSGYKDAGFSAYSLAPRVSFPVMDDVKLYGKLGAAYAEFADKSDTTLLGALGATYSGFDAIDLQLEFSRLAGVDADFAKLDGDMLTLGFSTKFGGSDEPAPEPVQEVMVKEEPAPVVEEVVAEPVVVAPVMRTYSTKVDSGSFAFNSAEVKPETAALLAELVQFMNQYPQAEVVMTGYTDSSGPAEYNQQLSEKRAKAVAEAVVAQGIDASRVSYRGEGENNPIASNSTAEGRAENRRVEILVPEFQYEEK
jgi:OOP family OmpA-OmpF porin